MKKHFSYHLYPNLFILTETSADKEKYSQLIVLIFNLLLTGKLLFKVLWNVMSICSMPICNPKVVNTLELTQMRWGNITVLIYFHRIAWGKSFFSCKWKLSDTVFKFMFVFSLLVINNLHFPSLLKTTEVAKLTDIVYLV
jgi:hypothetical protein